ncbi:hypothetical protein H4582DRAFT_2058944 [Lactarius indigo]|nr:hypothetical protein H4582DRAFT_2058944 [Lactarius indigo]
MSQSRSPLSILVSTQQLRIIEDSLLSAEGQDDYGMGGESSPESKHSFGMDGSPSPVAQDDFGMGRSPSPVAQDDFGMGGSPSPTVPADFGMDSPPPTLPTRSIGSLKAARVWEWGKHAPPSSASEMPKGHDVTNSEAPQEVGDGGSFGMDGPPSPTAQDDFGMDLALPAEVRECVGNPSAACGEYQMDLALPAEVGESVGISSAAHNHEVKDLDSFGMDGPPSPMAQDDFGMDSPVSPGARAQGTTRAPLRQDGMPNEDIRADLALPTKAGERVGIHSVAHIRTFGGNDLSPSNSQVPVGHGDESVEVLHVQVQHPPEQVLQEEFDLSTRAAILRAEGSRNRRIHAQVWNIYQQEKEMSEVIDEIIEELDNTEVQNLVYPNVKASDRKTYECAQNSLPAKNAGNDRLPMDNNEYHWDHSGGTCQGKYASASHRILGPFRTIGSTLEGRAQAIKGNLWWPLKGFLAHSKLSATHFRTDHGWLGLLKVVGCASQEHAWAQPT